MIRKLMAGSAVLALITAAPLSIAQAQTDPAAETQAPAATEQPAAGADATTAPAAGADTAEPAEQQTEIAADAPTLTPDQPTIATAFIGRSVYSSENPDSDNIGEVNDLIIGSDGMITHAIVGVGGFLGIGQKDVSVPFDQLQVVQTGSGDVRLIYAATREQLESAEAFDRTAFDPQERAEEQQETAAETSIGTGTDATQTTGGGIATAPGALPGAAVDPQTTEQTQTEQTTAEQTTADPPAAVTDMAANTPPTTPVVAGEGGFVSFSADQVRASTMIGEEIYGAENEAIGEVSDLILQQDGTTRAAVVDVGGFLGVGEKRVVIPFNDIEMMQPAETAAMQPDPAAAPADPAAPAGGTTTDPAAAPPAPGTAATDPAAPPATATAATAEPRLTVAMTREQLEQLPAWEDQTASNAQGGGAGTMTDPNAPAPTDPNAPAATDPNAPAATGTQTAGAEAQFQPVSQDLTAESLMGSAVLGANEENLGEVGDVVFDPNGAIQAVVVDVGGFLGIGEKQVAVQFDSLNVQKNGDGDMRLMVNATQEQLQNAPAYTADAASGQQQPAVQ